jgi:SAM-dependent methyltransferase
MTDYLEHNRQAWNRESASGTSRWCEPVSDHTIDAARRGDWQVILTPNRPVPRDWFGALEGARILCLAAAGGQQAPVLAATGAAVVSYDLSDQQLARDSALAERHGLDLRTVRGDMSDLARFGDGGFDLIFHPVSNLFVPDLDPVWQACHRVLRPGGRLLAGFMNPAYFLFDHEAIEAGAPLTATFQLPYSDASHLDAERLQRKLARAEALEFGHSLQAQIGGQLAAGFTIRGFYEDRWEQRATPLDAYLPTSMATLALR